MAQQNNDAITELLVKVQIVSAGGSQNGNDLNIDISDSSGSGNSHNNGNDSSQDSTGTGNDGEGGNNNNNQPPGQQSGTNQNTPALNDSLFTLSIPQTSPNAGWLQISGPEHQTVIMTLQPPDALTSADGSSIPFNAKAAYNSDEAQPGGATPYGSQWNANKNVQLNAKTNGNDGSAYVWVYGDLHVSTPKPGNYVGVFQVTVAY